MDQDYPNSPPVDESRNSKATLQSSEPWRVTIVQSITRDGSIDAVARMLYIILQSYVSPEAPTPFPSLDTLAGHLGCHRKTVQRHLKELETWGLITRSFVKDAGKWHPTRYTLFPHKPKGKKAHRRHFLSPGQKRPSSITHSVPLKLVRKTPKPESPTSRKKDLSELHHPAGCICLECKAIREAAGF